jgi:hypothetical protein
VASRVPMIEHCRPLPLFRGGPWARTRARSRGGRGRQREARRRVPRGYGRARGSDRSRPDGLGPRPSFFGGRRSVCGRVPYLGSRRSCASSGRPARTADRRAA